MVLMTAVGAGAVGGLNGECVGRELVDDVGKPDAAQNGGLVELEVESPHIVGALSAPPSRGAVCEPLALGLGRSRGRGLQPFVAPDALCTLEAGHQSLTRPSQGPCANPVAYGSARSPVGTREGGSRRHLEWCRW